ncbi:major facilitator superfamily domain-containing protein [Cercophora newfieldiana]|uniref:Major facilitator superfamily domain-containing protein n=1 Tax=Cercophora newfieldiana TaxID=92897 RepID=A0AA39Y8A6_9PEZI|nr:major facilitator superfamily domain-containing protein [Cercophora newfieldiana]
MNSLNKTPPNPRSIRERANEIIFVLVLCLGQFLSLAGIMQTVSPVLILANYFDIHDYGSLSWFSAAYSLTVGTFILPAGRVGDMYGHKRVLTAGWAWFAIWSFACGFCSSKQLVLFSVFRAFQGIGPALVIPNAIAIIGRTFPVGLKRNIAFACFSAAGPTGAALGAVMAALVAETISWHWCFRLLGISCALLVPVSHWIIPNPDLPFPLDSEEPPQFDWPGAVTGMVGLVLVNFSLNQAPLIGWTEPYVLILFAIGLSSLAAFAWVEFRVAAQPIIPMRGLQRSAAFALACVFAGWSSHGIWVYYFYIFLEHLRGQSALISSVEMTPAAVTGVCFAFLAVWLMRRVAVSCVMFFSMCFFALGSLLMATAPLRQTYWGQTFFAVALIPGAMNLSFPAATILLSSALPKEKQGIAASLVATVVNYSISCGLGLAGSIHKQAAIYAAQENGLQGDPPALSVTNPQLVTVRLFGLRSAYWFSVALGVLGMVIAAVFLLVQRFGADESGRTRRDEARKSVAESEKMDVEYGPKKLPKVSTSSTTFYIGDKIIEDMKQHKFSVTVGH